MPVRTPVRRLRVLTKPEVDQLAVAYAAGASLNKLGRRFGVHRQTVQRHLADRGVLRPVQWMTPEIAAQVAEALRARVDDPADRGGVGCE